MSATHTPSAPPDRDEDLPQERAVRRWWFFPLVAVGVLFLMLLLAVAALALKMWSSHRQAARAVAAEVARIQAAGEPITTEDFYAFHRVQAGTRDITQVWLDALASFDENQVTAAAGNLPIVGLGPDVALLRADVDNSQLAAAEQFLKDHEPTLTKLHAAAQLDGECRFPVEFKNGVGALLPHAQKLRTVARLFRLEARVKTHRGDTDGAIRSIADLLATGRTLEHQLSMIEQLVRIACQTIAFQEIEFLMNETQLTDQQLAEIQKLLQGLDLQSGLTMALMGERGTSFHAFHHLGDMQEEMGGLNLGGADGALARPADCQKSLELLGRMIEASKKPFPAARREAKNVEAQLVGIVGSSNPLEKFKYLVTAMLMPATGAATDATARTIARRDALLVALAAERYRLKTGAFPAKLADLVPDYLPAVPVDPYDGSPLRLVAGEGELVIYSVGKDEIDDQGVERQQAGEPDVAIRVRVMKGSLPK